MLKKPERGWQIARDCRQIPMNEMGMRPVSRVHHVSVLNISVYKSYRDGIGRADLSTISKLNRAGFSEAFAVGIDTD